MAGPTYGFGAVNPINAVKTGGKEGIMDENPHLGPIYAISSSQLSQRVFQKIEQLRISNDAFQLPHVKRRNACESRVHIICLIINGSWEIGSEVLRAVSIEIFIALADLS